MDDYRSSINIDEEGFTENCDKNFVILKENEQTVELLSAMLILKKDKEYDVEYPIYEAYLGDTIISYDKNTKDISGEIPDNFDDIVNTYQIKLFISTVLKYENKFLYMFFNYKDMNQQTCKNLLSILIDKNFSKLEACARSYGNEFIINGLRSEHFELKNMKKLSDNASLQFILTLILHLNLKRVIIQKKS